MTNEIYFFQPVEKQTFKFSFWRGLLVYAETLKYFEKENGRKASSKESEIIFKEIFPDKNNYEGICPICKSETVFTRNPPSANQKFWMQVIKSGVLIILKPIASLKQILSTHKCAFPSFCDNCGEGVVICPVCNAYAGLMPVDPAEKVVCPNCKSVI